MKSVAIELFEPSSLHFLLKAFDIQDSLMLSLDTEDALKISAKCKDGTGISLHLPITSKIRLDDVFFVDALTFIDALEMLLSVYGSHLPSIFASFDANGDFLEVYSDSAGQMVDLRLRVRLIHSIYDPPTDNLPSQCCIPFHPKTLLKLLPDHLFSDCEELMCHLDSNNIHFELCSVKGSASTFYTSEQALQVQKMTAKIPISTYKSLRALLRRCEECSMSIGPSFLSFSLCKNLIEANHKINICLKVN